MNSFLKKLRANPRHEKIFTWVKLISITGSAEIIVYAVGFISGILVVRLLPTQEYALYTLANTMLGTMLVLADGGISTGVMALGAKVHDNPQKLGVVTATGFHLRKKFAVGSILIAAPILIYLLNQNGIKQSMFFSWEIAWANMRMIVLIILSLIPAFLLSFSTNLLEIVAKIKQDITPLQKIKVTSNLGRLSLLCLTVFFFPFAFVAVFVSGLPQIWANWRLKKTSGKYSDFSQKPDPVVEKEILGMVKLILPGAVYYSISGQIAIWLISFFGNTNNIAQLGGLNRISVVLSLFSAVVFTLIAPRFARLPDNKGLIIKRFFQIQVGLFALCLFVSGLVFLFSTQILWVLGKGYLNLEYELVLNIIASCIGLIASATYSLFTYRGWNINPIISISINIVSIAIGAAIFNLATVSGNLYLNIFVAVIVVAMNFVFMAVKISQLGKKATIN